jgi:epoxide hydrolase-like predicted phosphatase
MTIRAIIFDLGGVLLRTADFTPREQLASRMGMTRHELEEFIFGGESGNHAQAGDITVRQHWENLRHRLNFSAEQFETLIDEFFGCDELDGELVDYVRELHKDHRTALLSNAWDDLRQIIAERWHFEDAFDSIIISAEVGLVKPDPRIYHLALECLGVEAGQAVFVDDFQRNVEAAQEVGLHGIHFQSPQQMRLELEQLLNGH